MKKELKPQLNKTLADFAGLVTLFEPEHINLIPFEGSWTAGQVARHIIMSNAGFAEIMNGPVKKTERNPDEWVQTLKNDFLNFNIKFQSPEFILPPRITYNKEDLLKELAGIQVKINEVIDSSDLTSTCLAFELPVCGFLTRLEAIHFILYHTQRHTYQLNNIYTKVVENAHAPAGRQ